MKRITLLLVVSAVTIFSSGCGFFNGQKTSSQIPVNAGKMEPMTSPIINRSGDTIGQATFTETDTGVKIRVTAEGLEPGIKGIHIHSVGVCETPTFESAGSHFNPFGKQHGIQNPKGAHAGDLPNIEIDQEGNVDLEVTSPEVTLQKGFENSLLDQDGSALLIHENPDDYKTDPAGNSGERIACAVIK